MLIILLTFMSLGELLRPHQTMGPLLAMIRVFLTLLSLHLDDGAADLVSVLIVVLVERGSFRCDG